jgi:hypothetical protein
MVLSSARQTPEALRLTEQAIARDPHYGPALAWAAFCCFRLLLTDRLKGVDFARRALEAAGDDPGVLANDTWQRRDFGSGKLAVDSWHRPIFDISCGGAVLRASVIDLCSFNELLAKKRSY